MTTPEPKTCASCGRRIEWRRKWARDWEQIRFCSQACRRRGVTDEDLRLEEVLRDLVGRHPKGVSPSEAARQVGNEGSWEELVEPARRAARRLVAAGRASIVQRGRVVDPSTAKGDFLVRRG